MNIKLSKSSWEQIGKQKGWLKTAVINDDGFADGGEAYTDEEVDAINAEENKRLTFSMGTTPEKIIKEKTLVQTPDGYPMHIRSNEEWVTIAKAVNQGIDSHLEGFTRSKFDHTTGKCLIHPEEMTTFLRRLSENGDEVSSGLRGSILETLGIEEI